MKKFAGLLLAVIMVASMIPIAVIPAAAEEAQPTFYEFLDVGAGAYIDTGIKPNENTRVVMDVMVMGKVEYWFGVWDIDYCHSAFALGNDSDGIYSGYYNEGGTDGSVVSDGRHTVELDKGVVKVDHSVILKHGRIPFTLNNTLYLFAQNRNGQVGLRGNEQTGIRFYSCQIYEGDDLVRDFVPAKLGNEVGVYDRQSKEFFKKQGSASMTAVGRIVFPESGLTEYHWLDVEADAYIDTRIVPTKDTRVVMDMEQDKAPETALFGVAKDFGGYALYSFDNGQLVYFYGDGGTFEAGTMKTGRHTVETDKNAVKIDGVQTYSGTDQSISVDGHTMYLFAVNNINGSPAGAWSGDGQFIRFYSCKIYEGDNLVRDFVPAKLGDEVGVYDRQSEEFFEKQGGGSMDAYVDSYNSLARGSNLPTNGESIAIDFDGKITVSQNTTITARPMQSGILIGKGRNITIEIKKGASLTVTGGDAVGRYGAGAGIEVPEDATLNIIGEGTLIVKGGNAAVGEDGGKGADGWGTCTRTSGTDRYMSTGGGGKGGDGGGGAGAGIGGRGGNGGAGGNGGTGVYSEQSTEYGWKSGNAGSNGDNGNAGSNGGKITVADTLKGKIQGGFAFMKQPQGNGYGNKGYGRLKTNLIGLFYNEYIPFGGGGGGAGGNGYAGAGIGNGGAGAGGGGGGGSGLVIYRMVITENADSAMGTGHSGTGGTGFVNGGDGLDQGKEENTDELVAGAGGKGGVAGKNNVSGDNVIYLDDASRAADMKYRLDVDAKSYFDIGYVPTENTRLVFDAEVNNKEAALFGVIWHDNDHGSASHNYYVNSGGTSFGFGFGKEDAKWADDAPLSAGRHTVELDGYALKYDGVIKEQHEKIDFTVNGSTIYLCGINIDNWAQTFDEQFIRLYSCQIHENGKLVRDFIPTVVGNEAMLLDRINGVLYENRGNGYIAVNPIETPENENTAFGSMLSNGSLTIIVGVAAAAIFGFGGFFLGTKKKKKPALAGGENKDEE